MRGVDPRQRRRDAAERERELAGLAFGAYAERFLAHYADERGRRPRSVAHARQIIATHLTPVLGSKPMPTITRADLLRALDAIPAARKGARRSAFSYASILFRWAEQRGDITTSPVGALPKPPAPASRDRVLSDTELLAAWRASETLAAPFGAFVRLLVLTGQRRSEVAGMGWQELDRSTATWLLPAERAKNGIAHSVPLSAPAVAELDQLAGGECWPKAGPVLRTSKGVAVNSFSKLKAKLDAATGDEVGVWRMHDLRRTLATGLQRLGVRFEVVEAVLAHVSGARSGVAGIYQRHNWGDEKRSALDAWAAHVGALLTGDERDNVVKLRA
jgi:integrase